MSGNDEKKTTSNVPGTALSDFLFFLVTLDSSSKCLSSFFSQAKLSSLKALMSLSIPTSQPSWKWYHPPKKYLPPPQQNRPLWKSTPSCRYAPPATEKGTSLSPAAPKISSNGSPGTSLSAAARLHYATNNRRRSSRQRPADPHATCQPSIGTSKAPYDSALSSQKKTRCWARLFHVAKWAAAWKAPNGGLQIALYFYR